MHRIHYKRLVWIGGGVLIGAVITAILLPRPVQAVATQGADGFALSTGQLDTGLEGVFFLDSLTGDLRGAALNLATGKFNTLFETNVMRDLQNVGVDVTKGAKFLMVTGSIDLRQGPSQDQPGDCVVYVSEVNSGVCLAYGVRWNRGRANQVGTPMQRQQLVPLDFVKFRTVAVRPQ